MFRKTDDFLKNPLVQKHGSIRGGPNRPRRYSERVVGEHRPEGAQPSVRNESSAVGVAVVVEVYFAGFVSRR